MTRAASSACHVRQIDAHFAGHASPAREREMRAHVADCGSCRAHYERHLLLARLDPAVPNGRARLAAGLGLRVLAAPDAVPLRRWRVGAIAAAAACVALFSLWPSPAFHSRGRPLAFESGLAVYRLGGDRPTLLDARDGAAIASGDELAFAYRNPEGYQALLVYGVDEHGHVYWYFPAWPDNSTEPAGIPIAAGPELHELGDAVSHALDGRSLRLFGLFTNRRLTVREVEARLASEHAAEGASSTTVGPGDRLFRLDLHVERRAAP